MLLDDLNKNTIREAFLAKETNSRRRAEQSIAGTSDLALVSFNNSKNDQECDFCGFKGHTSADCRKLVSARSWARKPCPVKKHAANNADTEPEPSTVVESAGNASANHLSSSPLQIDANFDWNADSGATSHMTPHAHWIRQVEPFRTPIRLANNLIVYSAGVGSVVFSPTIRGRKARDVEFTRVLHVPDLRTNLLSILYLTRHKQFIIHINSHDRAACRTRNNGYDGRLLRVNTRPIWALNSACDGRISTAVTRRHPSQNGRYARFTGTGKVQNHFCIPLSIYVTHIMRLGLVRHMAS